MVTVRDSQNLPALRQTLETGIDWMRAMKATLDEERAALETRDSQGLAAASSAKEQLAKRLRSVDWGRLERSLPDKAERGDATAIRQRWRSFVDLASDCARSNRTNGAIIGARRQQWWISHARTIRIGLLAILDLLHACEAVRHHLHVGFHYCFSKPAKFLFVLFSYDTFEFIGLNIVILKECRNFKE